MQWAHGHNNSIVNGIPRIGYMKGGKKARWKDEDMADYFVDKVKNFITEHRDSSFFLFIMVCMNLMCHARLINVLLGKRLWDLVEMQLWKQTGVWVNY